MKKYEFTGEEKVVGGITLRRIRAVRRFAQADAGEMGGWIQKEENLSHDGECWVSGEALVCNSARVTDDAWVGGHAQVYYDAKIRDNACISGDAWIGGSAEVYGNARVGGNTVVNGHAKIYDRADVMGHAIVRDSARACGEALVDGNSIICQTALVHGDAKVHNVLVPFDTEIKSIRDYIVFKNFWSSGRFFTYFRSNGMWQVGCFWGTSEELLEAAKEDGEVVYRGYKRAVDYVKSALADGL